MTIEDRPSAGFAELQKVVNEILQAAQLTIPFVPVFYVAVHGLRAGFAHAGGRLRH
jgi:hypothetical protein